MELTDRLKQKVADYIVPPSALAPIQKAPLLFTVGITAAGKNATLDYLLKRYPEHYQFIRSYTTRPMREYETQGVQYHFVDFPAIEKMVDNHEFIEVQVIHFDHVYGTSIAEIKNAYHHHRVACNDLDIQGVDDYMALGLNLKAVFLLPPTYEIWKQRLLKRYDAAGSVDPKDLRNRLQSALIEIEHALDMPHYYIVVNDDLAKSSELVHKIATGKDVTPHDPKSVKAAQDIMEAIRADLA